MSGSCSIQICDVDHVIKLAGSAYPTSNGGIQNESSVGICVQVAHTLSRKFIKSALLVGC